MQSGLPAATWMNCSRVGFTPVSVKALVSEGLNKVLWEIGKRSAQHPRSMNSRDASRLLLCGLGDGLLFSDVRFNLHITFQSKALLGAKK